MSNTTTAFAIFPYLSTRERFILRGIEFRSSKEFDNIPSEIHDHLRVLCDMFFVGDGVQITDMIYAYLPGVDKQTFEEKELRRLHEVQLLIGYLYSSPHPGGGIFLPFESSTLFVFQPQQVSSWLVWNKSSEEGKVRVLDERAMSAELVDGYEGTRNLATHLWVAAGSRIYPEIPHQVLNLSQSVGDNVVTFLSRDQNWALRRLYLQKKNVTEKREVESRVFIALEWYLRSCRKGINEPESLVHLAIALESLLKLPPGEGLTERFKEAVLTLVGPVPRLDSWIEQFYTARSKAVHEGAPHELLFFASDKETAKAHLKKKGERKKGEGEKNDSRGNEPLTHRSLADYGRRIFRLCLTTLMSAAENAELIGLDKLFVLNRERIESICKTLSKNEDPTSKLLAIERLVHELHEFFGILHEPYVDIKTLLGATRCVLKVFLESKPTLSDEARNTIDGFLGADAKKAAAREQIMVMETIASLIRAVMQGGTVTGAHNVVLAFLAYSTSSAFQIRAMVDDQRAQKAGHS
jgi:hypothetical protein